MGLGTSYLSLWKLQFKSRATEPATKMSALEVVSCALGSSCPTVALGVEVGNGGLGRDARVRLLDMIA